MSRTKIKTMIKKIKKRDGRIVAFRPAKIERAIWQAAKAAGGKNRKRARYLAGLVVKELEKRFNQTLIPEVEQVQDMVEQILLKKGHEKTYRAFILYRDLHTKLRDIRSLVDSDELIQKYLDELDWRVKENANMTYSLQGLNNHVGSIISANFWLNKIYPRQIRKAHRFGDLHIHNLAQLSPYCTGWDLKDLLMRGFGGVPGKVWSKPAKHFSVALGQLVNFFYTVQGEVAGAVAIANFDTYLAPFIAFDKLTEKQVKQQMQEFVYNMNVPTRVGFQCVSEDTEILTSEGWRNYQEVKKGSSIKTFNIKTQKIEDQKVVRVFKKNYQGVMYNLKNRIQDQLISPGHRVARKKFQTDKKFVLEPIEEVIKLRSPFIIPIAGSNPNRKAGVSDEQIKLMAWIISEGTIERPGQHRCCYRVSIYQSKIKNKKYYEEIKSLLDYFKLKYSEYEVASLGAKVARFRLNAESSRVIHKWFGTRENVHFIPEVLLNLSQEQSRLFLKTYLKADGSEGCKISTGELGLLDDLQRLVVNCGYGFTVLVRQPTIGKKEIYILRIIRHPETYVQKVRKVKYKGIIWCPHTKNETIIARRKGKVFITGNTPFTNVTLDLKPTATVAKEAVVIGGKPTNHQYGEYQKEINLFNKAFAEVLMAGDAHGRVFTFPIPTYSITDDFDWTNPVLEPIFEVTRKYGIPYWANYVNSEMKPEDVRSMCFAATERIFYKNNNQSPRVGYTEVRSLVENWLISPGRRDMELLRADKSFKVKRVIKLKNKEEKLIKVILKNGESLRMTLDHPAIIVRSGELTRIRAENLEEGMIVPLAEKGYEGELGDYELGKFIGLYLSEGSLSKKGCVYFSFNKREKDLINFVVKIAQERFVSPIQITEDPRWETTQVWVNSQVMVELAKRFCSAAKARFKQLKSQIFSMNREFRQGVLDGLYLGDGYRRDMDFHTTNRKLRDQVAHLAASLGICYLKRDNYKNTEGNKVFTSYVLRISTNSYGCFKKAFPSLKKRPSTIFRKYKNFWGVKIKKIEKVLYKGFVYDFEVDDKDHLFQLANGIITHNCCRLQLDNRVLRKRGGLFAANPLTGAIGVVTVNLPRIGYLAKTKKELFSRLGEMMDLAKESLIIKREAVEEFTKRGLYPYCRHYLQDVYQRTGKYWRNHFNTIGIIGMNEMLLNFLGCSIVDEEGKKLAIEVMNFAREHLIEYQKETDELFNLEATPAEGTSYALALLDKEHFKKIIVANEKEVKEKKAEPFYTNSTFLPVDYTEDIYEALEHQDELQTKYTGGTVFHGFLGEALSDNRVLKKTIEKISRNFRLPYFTLTPTFSICTRHGYLQGEKEKCPKCGAPCEVYSRIVGYLRPVNQWNPGKQAEFGKRREYKISK